MPGEVVIKVHQLMKYFEIKKGFLEMFVEPVFVKAVDNVDFELSEGEVLGLVGESGCGKTTVGRLLTRLEDPTSGSVFFQGRDIALLQDVDLKVFRRNIQMVFQDPYESLSPRSTVLQTIMEPLINHGIGDTFEERVEMVIKALEDAGLAPAKEYLARFPHELSGGQRQRVSVARALVINPKVIVADEPVSMLDVSIRAGVLNLMLDLRDKYGIPYLFITHDIAVARYVSDRLAVMYLGKIVEIGETDDVVFEPKHPYTQALISAVPVPDPEQKHGRAKIVGEIPSAINLPMGCRFRPRCLKAFEVCGWEAIDMADWLVTEEHVTDPEHPMSGHVDKLQPAGFVLLIHIKPGGSPEGVRSYLEAKMGGLKQSNPMFRAIASVDEVIGNKQIVVKCSSVKVDGSIVARELHKLLEATVDFRSRTHPMYGVILDIRQDGDKVVVSVGAGERDSAAAGKSNAQSTKNYIADFVKHHRRKKEGHPEFAGVKRIETDGLESVVVDCVPARMTAARVTREVAEMIRHDFMQGPEARAYEALLPIEIRASRILIQVRGPEDSWTRLAELIRRTFTDIRSSRPVSMGVKEVTIEPRKGPASIVAVRFITAERPPLVEAAPGHKVACHLYSHKRQEELSQDKGR